MSSSTSLGESLKEGQSELHRQATPQALHRDSGNTALRWLWIVPCIHTLKTGLDTDAAGTAGGISGGAGDHGQDTDRRQTLGEARRRAALNDLIIIENNTPLADSRVVAEQLGVDHGDFFQNTILKYQEEVEADFGLIRFENGAVKTATSRGTKYVRYALLTEDQTNTYMSYARNTEQARACKRKLVKAFSDAKKIIAQLLKEKPRHQFNFKYQERLHLNRNVRIYGYIPATKFLDDINLQFLEDVIVLSETSSPDISLGIFLASRLPREPWYDAKLIKKPVGGTDRSKWNQEIVMTVYVKDGYQVPREVTHFPVEWYPHRRGL